MEMGRRNRLIRLSVPGPQTVEQPIVALPSRAASYASRGRPRNSGLVARATVLHRNLTHLSSFGTCRRLDSGIRIQKDSAGMSS